MTCLVRAECPACAGQGKEVGGKRCVKQAACGVIAALSGRRAALYAKCICRRRSARQRPRRWAFAPISEIAMAL